MEEESLEKKFEKERLEWTNKVDEMSKKVLRVMEIPELMTILYTERQRAVDYYHYLIQLLIPLNRKYRSQYTEKQDFYTNKSQIRYSSEGAKDLRIKVELADLLEKRETLENHSRFIERTIGTIDAIIFAVPRRVEIEQISRGK